MSVRVQTLLKNVGGLKLHLLILLLVGIIVGLLHAADLVSEWGTDYEVYFANGWFITKGLLPYVDFWTHKAPLLVMVLAGWISVFGQSFSSSIAFLIMVAIFSSYLVFVLALRLKFSRGTALLSTAIYIIFVSSHVMDPGRNGIIVVLASVLEMLSLIVLLLGIKKRANLNFLLSGFIVFLAFATRQTAAITYLGLLAVLFFGDASSSFRQSFQRSLFLSGGAALAALLFALFFVMNKVPFAAIWDQVYRFNVLYSEGYETRITWWISGWIDALRSHNLYLPLVGTAAFVLYVVISTAKRTPIDRFEWILLVMFFLHGVAVVLSRKIQVFYLIQLLPEISIATSMIVVRAFSDVYNSHPPFLGAGNVTRTYIAGSFAVLLLFPLKEELLYTYGAFQSARENGSLSDVKKRSSHIVAKKVQELATSKNDRIWVLGFGDEIYVLANRLPALAYTDAARLQYVFSQDEYSTLQHEFLTARPKVVVNYLTQRWRDRYKEKPMREASGRNAENLLKIGEFIAANMNRVNHELEVPEIYVWK